MSACRARVPRGTFVAPGTRIGIRAPDFRQPTDSSKEGAMRSRVRLATLVAIAMFATATGVMSGDGVGRRQWAAVYLNEPTMIGATIVQGPVVFVHEDAKMARGEPCTSVLLFEPGKGPTEEIAAFHCIPTARPRVH